MRYGYFDQNTRVVSITLDPHEGLGTFIGMVTDDDFYRLNYKFLVSAWLSRLSQHPTALDIRVEEGPILQRNPSNG